MTTGATVSARPRRLRQRPAGSGRRTSSWSSGSPATWRKVMTFRSLYRLERRGLLDCPIVGVAVDDWTRRPARRARPRVDRRHRRAARRGRVRPARRAASRTSRATSPTRRRTSAWRRRSRTPSSRSSTWRSRRSSSAGWSRGSRDAGLTKNARVVVEKPFGHDRESAARARRRSCTSTSTSRSSTGSTTTSGRWGSRRSSTSASRTRCSSRCGAGTTSSAVQITMAEDFGVEDRGHFYDPVGALRDVVVNHLMQVVAAAAMEPPARGDPETIKDAQVALFQRRRRGRPGALRARASTTATARSTASRRTRRPRRTPRCGSTSRTGAGPACRSSSAPASGCRSPRPSCGSSSSTRRSSASGCSSATLEPNQLVVKLDPSHRDQARSSRRTGPTRRRGADRARHGVRRAGRRGPDPLRGAAARRDDRRQHPLHAPGRRRGDLARSCSRCSTRRRRSTRYAPGSWGPEAAERSSSPATAAGTGPGSP